MAVADYVPPITQLMQENSDLRSQLHQAQETLRDRFAMAALTGLVFGRKELINTFVKEAYQIADAMLKQRDISRTCGKSD